MVTQSGGNRWVPCPPKPTGDICYSDIKYEEGHRITWEIFLFCPTLQMLDRVRAGCSRLRGCLGWLQIPHEVQVLVPAIPLWPNSLLTHPRRQAMTQALGPLLLKWRTQVEFQYPGLAWSSHCDYLGSEPVSRRSLPSCHLSSSQWK